MMTEHLAQPSHVNHKPLSHNAVVHPNLPRNIATSYGQICGAAAKTGETQDVPDVHARPEHIACSSSTLSEVVVPVKSTTGDVVAVLDLDSDYPAAFSPSDIEFTEHLCQYLGNKYF